MDGNLLNNLLLNINEDIRFNIHNHTVKRLNWLQIPSKIIKFVPSNKCYYWNETLTGIPEINRKKTYLHIHKNGILSLKVKSISHAYIYLEYYFGPQCLYMPTIEH